MGLKLAGETGVGESLEQLAYEPGLPDSGDLEPATRTVTAVAKPAVADYTTALGVIAPADPRIQVKQAGLRLGVTIDSFGGTPAATRLNYAVEVNGVQRLTGFWTAVGAQYAVVDLTPGQFSLGTANTIGVFLWVDQGQAVVSLCQVWLGAGTTGTSFRSVLTLSHTGLLALSAHLYGVGSGSPLLEANHLSEPAPGDPNYTIAYVYGFNNRIRENSLLTASGLSLDIQNSVATDLAILSASSFVLRRQE